MYVNIFNVMKNKNEKNNKCQNHFIIYIFLNYFKDI